MGIASCLHPCACSKEQTQLLYTEQTQPLYTEQTQPHYTEQTQPLWHRAQHTRCHAECARPGNLVVSSSGRLSHMPPNAPKDSPMAI